MMDNYFKLSEIRMLIVDEIHNILVGAVSRNKKLL